MPLDNEDTSIRDDLAAAFDAAEKESPPVVESAAPASTDAPAPREDSGEKVESSAVSAAKVEPTEEKDDKQQSTTNLEVPEGSPEGKTHVNTLHLPEKAPASWKPAIREQWAGLPAEVKAEIQRREKEITRTLTETTESRKFHERFKNTVAPYRHIVAMEGSDEIGAFEAYLKTGAVLRQGTAWEKASSLAGVIKQFGIDPVLLDNALVGQMPPQGQQNPAEFRDPRLDQLLQQQEQNRQRQLQQLDQEAESDIAQFRALPTSEFFDDVEDLMSDILSMASQRRIKMSLQEAYDRATMIHPEVSKALELRRSASSAAAQSGVVSAAKKKVLPRGGSPLPAGAAPASGGSNSIRSDIEAAIDRLGSM